MKMTTIQKTAPTLWYPILSTLTEGMVNDEKKARIFFNNLINAIKMCSGKIFWKMINSLAMGKNVDSKFL